MLNDYIGGGQVFLHKIRMFTQVFWRSVHVAVLVGSTMAVIVYVPQILREDLLAALSYRKAVFVQGFDEAISSIKQSRNANVTKIAVKTKHGVYARDIEPRKVLSSKVFREADHAVMALLTSMLQFAAFASGAGVFLVFLLWNRFGKSIKDDKKVKGGRILTPDQVNGILKGLGMASSLKIGDMPIVKDSETRHFLICGSTGSGKTNLIDTILPQVEARGEAAIIVDQTGEMIAKYYDPSRGDIIFNPLDSRSHDWDLWADCFDNSSVNNSSVNTYLEKFAKILFSFNRCSSGSNSDPFWENSAETVFIEVAGYASKYKGDKLGLLNDMLSCWSFEELSEVLSDTPASRYLNAKNKITANSILSVMTTLAKPLSYLIEPKSEKSFGLRNHLKEIRQGSKAWLFLTTKPSQRELTLPLIACLLELAVSLLMENGSKGEKKLWFVLDELAALGRLPALSGLMTEGRKYGACVIAAMQSLNQLYGNYGQYAGSTIFGQFGTKFFFRNDEPQIAKMITDLCGSEIINKQQKNTSFGANELRDGVSYTEQEKQKPLVEYSDVSSLKTGMCYVLLPEPKVRLSKIEVPESKILIKNEEFVGYTTYQETTLPQHAERLIEMLETNDNQAVIAKSGKRLITDDRSGKESKLNEEELELI